MYHPNHFLAIKRFGKVVMSPREIRAISYLRAMDPNGSPDLYLSGVGEGESRRSPLPMGEEIGGGKKSCAKLRSYSHYRHPFPSAGVGWRAPFGSNSD
jgi:hypothetical protein